MSNEEKIKNLEERLVKLEKIERRRKIMSYISLGFRLLVLIILIIFGIKAYNYLKQYKEQLDKFQTLQDKLDVSSDYIDEQMKNLEKFNIFK